MQPNKHVQLYYESTTSCTTSCNYYSKMSTIHIQTGKNRLSPNLNAELQSLPFKIHADCDANVNNYFKPYVRKTDECLTASFRGYPLQGAKIDVPTGYKGIILHESVRPRTDSEDRKFYIIHTFDELTYWNWDKLPSKNDPLVKALDWIDIAEALHAPITE